MYDFNEWLREKDESLYNEINWQQMGRNAAMGAAMSASMMGNQGMQQTQQSSQFQPQQVSQPQDDQVRQRFDNFSQANNTMTPDQWKQDAGKYGKPKMGAWVPNPQKPGQWIPANDADSVRVQSRTEINNDELTRDDVDLTPYKNGKPVSTGKSTTTPFDGKALYNQAMQMRR